MSRCEYLRNEHCLAQGDPNLSSIILLPILGEVEGPGTAVSNAKACTAAGNSALQQFCRGFLPDTSGLSEEDSL